MQGPGAAYKSRSFASDHLLCVSFFLFTCFPNAVCVLHVSWLHFDHIVFRSSALLSPSLLVRGRASRFPAEPRGRASRGSSSSGAVCVDASTPADEEAAVAGRAPSQPFGIALLLGCSFGLLFAVAPAASSVAYKPAELELVVPSKGDTRGRASRSTPASPWGRASRSTPASWGRASCWGRASHWVQSSHWGRASHSFGGARLPCVLWPSSLKSQQEKYQVNRQLEVATRENTN